MPCWRRRWRQTLAAAAALRIPSPASTLSSRRCVGGCSQQWVKRCSSCGACCRRLLLNAAGMHDAISAAWQLTALVIALCVIHASAPVQVNQKTLTYVDPSRLAANQGKRQALGMQLLAWLPLCAAPAGNIQLCPVSWSHSVDCAFSVMVQSSGCCCLFPNRQVARAAAAEGGRCCGATEARKTQAPDQLPVPRRQAEGKPGSSPDASLLIRCCSVVVTL